jgi:hypothetical protein
MDHTFTGELFRWTGSAAWTFVEVPPDLAPPVTEGWGRTPVLAAVDGASWATSVWRGKDGRTLLAVPKKIRKGKGHGDQVTASIQWPKP